jgi:hypothetical protein
MHIQTKVAFAPEKTQIDFLDSEEQVTIFHTNNTSLLVKKSSVYLLMRGKNCVEIGVFDEQLTTKKTFDAMIQWLLPWDLDVTHVAQRLLQTAAENGLTFAKNADGSTIPANIYPEVTKYQEHLLLILNNFGFMLEKPKKKAPAKAQHRWRKELATIEFFVDDVDSKATILWQKRNELVIKKGAQLRKEYELNKDGSIGLGIRMGTQIREEQADKIKDFVTTEDVTLKSVNEIGLFLYYGGRNGWLVLKDANGKTIDEYSVVK